MKDIKLRSYQIEAIEAIQAALSLGQKRMAIEMPPDFGKSLVFAKTVEILSESNLKRILVVTGSLVIKEQILKDLSTNYSGFIHTKNENVLVENSQRLINNYATQPVDFDVIIFYDTIVTEKLYKALSCDEKTVILFSTFGNQISSEKRNNKLFDESKTVFSYTFQRGIKEIHKDKSIHPVIIETDLIYPNNHLFLFRYYYGEKATYLLAKRMTIKFSQDEGSSTTLYGYCYPTNEYSLLKID